MNQNAWTPSYMGDGKADGQSTAFTLLKITTDGCGNLMIETGDGDVLWTMSAGSGEPGSPDEFTDEEELLDQVRNAWHAINMVD